MNPDKRDELYNNLINSGKVSEAEIGSLDDFKAAITDEESARLFHQNLMGSGLFGADEIGSEDDFYSSISSDFAGTDVPQQPATSAAQGLAVNPYTMQPTAVRAPFADVQAAQQYEQQKPTLPTQPTNPAAAQNEQEQPLGPERFAKQMQMEQQLGQMSQDFTNRMEAIRKGNQPFGSGHQREFNPETGRMEDVYYTKAGERTNTPLAQWEENNKGLRLQQDIDQSLSALDGAAEAAWKTATEASGKEQSENIKMIARTGGFMPGGSGMGQLAMLNTASHLKYHDLQRMADDAWNSLGIVKQQAMIDGIYNTLRSHHYNDEASDEQLRAEAEAMARQENDRRLFDYAVKMNAPKDATDYFFRKALQNNAITMLKDFAARSMAGTTGDWEARDVAEQHYDMESLGHNLIGHAGGITGFLLDPTVLIGGAAAKGAVGGATKIAGKLAAKRGGAAWVAENAPTLIGKTTTGVVAGAGNFGTFESAQEALRQLRWGGKIEIDEKTGRYKIDGYDLGEVAKKFGHGALMGGTIGVLGPLTGNVGDRLVGYINKNGKPGTVANIMDKLGARTVQTGVCKTAEGTIFSIPEWIDTYKKYGEMIDAVSDPESKNYIADDYQRAKKIEELKAERAAEVMDTWTENEKMMLGFGLQHMVKSIPQRISELRDIDNARTMEERNHNRRDWLSKLNRMLDGRPDLALTRDEKDELQRRGYTDLADLVSEYKRWEDEKAVTEKARPDAIDANRMIGEGEDAAIPYNRFLQLMEDPTVSEAARAKMYYYLTGRQAPMSTVMGWSPIEEVKDANGKVTGYNVKSLGAKGVITSRTFADKAAAEAELQKIYRQAELNTLDIGERYYEGRGLSSEDLRDYVGKRHGVDVDASIRKDPNRRSKAEQEAVDEYTERLYVGVKTEEAYQRGYDADEQGRQDAMMELAMSDPSDPDHTEKQATVDGINQRINDDADMQVAQQREEAKVRTNKNDGAIHPATLIETDANGNPKEVFVVDGDFSMDADGNITGDETIVVYDPLEGKNRMVSPRDIAELGEVTTAEQQEQNIETNKQAYIQQQQDAATGRFNPQPGQEIDMPDGGKAVVLATDGDSVTLQMPDGTQQSMAIADIQQIADGVMMEDYRQRHPDTAAAEQPAAEAPAITEGKPETFEPNMELTIKDGEGEKTVYVTGTRARWEAGKFVEDPNGKFVELYDPEANGGNGGMTYIREDDPDGKIVGHRPMEQPAAEQTETPTEITEQAPEQPTENEQPTEAPTEEVQQPEPAVAPEAEIYNNVKGEYPEAYRDKVENTVKIKAKRVTDTKTALDKATAALTATEYGSKEEATAKRKRDEAQQAYDAAVADSEMWNAVKSLKDQELLAEREAKDAAEREERERRRAETEAARKREQEAYEVEMARRKAEQEEKDRRTEAALEYMAKMRDEAAAMGADFPIEDDAAAMEVMNDLEPHTLEEVAAWLLSDTKGKMKIDPEEMRRHTGYIRGTEGVDGDHIDVFLSDDPTQGNVFVIDQVNKDGSFDEHKVMYGFPDAESARAAYLSNYEEGWQGLGTITEVSKDEFKKWVESSHRKTKPFSEYKSVKPEGDVMVERQPSTAGAPTEYQRVAEQAVADIAKQLDSGRTAKNDELIQRIADMEAEAEERLEDNTLSDDERARVQAQYDAASKWMDDNVRSQKGMPSAPTAEQKTLTKGLVGWLNGIGIKTHAAVRKGQDMLNKYRELVRSLRAYHGSGADFDRFDHSKMGTGEGTQAFGYGTYVTQVEGIGKSYAEKLGDRPVPASYKGMTAREIETKATVDFLHKTKGEPTELSEVKWDALLAIVRSLNYGYGDPKRMMAVKRERIEETIKRAEKRLQKWQDRLQNADGKNRESIENSIRRNQEEIEDLKEALDYVNSLNPDDFKGWSRGGTHVLYEVEIPDDNGSNYLDYDGYVTEAQYPMWYEAMKKLGEEDHFATPEEHTPSKDGNTSVSVGFEIKAMGNRYTPEAVSKALHDAGFTGIKYPAQYMTGGRSDGAKNYVIFDDNDLKITDKIRFQRAADGEYEPKPVFYSNAANAVEGIKQEKATAEQWLAMLQKNGGLKAGEDKWIGLSDWINDYKGKSLTKQDILDYIRKNQIQVEEVEYYDAHAGVPAGYGNSLREEAHDLANNTLAEEFAKNLEEGMSREDAEDRAWNTVKQRMLDEYGSGVMSYFGIHLNEDREPEVYTTGTDRAFNDFADTVWHRKNGDSENAKEANATRMSYTTKGLKNKREIALTIPTIEPWNENDDVHFGDAGEGRAVAWVRFGETYLPSEEQKAASKAVDDFFDEMRAKYGVEKGDETSFLDKTSKEKIAEMQRLTAAEAEAKEKPGIKVLVIDEIQSKRHQEGREKGYRKVQSNSQRARHIKAQEKFESFKTELVEKYGSVLDNGSYNQWMSRFSPAELERYEQLEREVMETSFYDEAESPTVNDNRVPDAPFDKNWHEVAFKRMLRYAAENGFDKVAWNTGEQQAERYDIGNVISHINIEPLNYKDEDFGYEYAKEIVVYTKDGLNNFVIKATKEGIIRGGDNYNGESLQNVFGKELAEKIMSSEGKITIENDGLRIGGEGMNGFYDQILPRFADKYGKKWGVKTTDINLPNIGNNGLTMHSVDVTPEMKASVLEGQPMFFRDKDGEVIGYTLNGEIYIDPRYAKPETPVHEYVHLIVHAIRANNPQVWESWKQLAHGEQDVIDFVKAKYPEYSENEDDFWEEVIANYTGREGGKRLEDEMSRQMRETPDIGEKARIATIFHKLRDLLRRFWDMTKDIFSGSTKGIDNFQSMDDVVDLTLAALANKYDPRAAQERARDARDREYLDAVERGDMETAQQMVDEVAEKAGYTVEAYHGTMNGKFTVFDNSKGNSHSAIPYKNLHVFTSSKNVADTYRMNPNDERPTTGEKYGPSTQEIQHITRIDTSKATKKDLNLYEKGKISRDEMIERYGVEEYGIVSPSGYWYYYPTEAEAKAKLQEYEEQEYSEGQENMHVKLNLGHSYVFDAKGKFYRDAISELARENPNLAWDGKDNIGNWIGGLKENLYGYDSLIIKNVYDNGSGYKAEKSDVYYVKNSEQIKSADPVTYDDQGRVIPLSKRFDKRNADIRFQFAGERGAAAADRAEEVTHRIDNLGVAREMENEGKDAKAIKMATGWERGADGKWRYEMPDYEKFDEGGNLEWMQRHPDAQRYKDLLKKSNMAAFDMEEKLTAGEQEEFDQLKKDWSGVDFNKPMKNERSLTLEDFIEADELFKAYPMLKSIPVKIINDKNTNLAGETIKRNIQSQEYKTAKETLDKYPTYNDYAKHIEEEVASMFKDVDRGFMSRDNAERRANNMRANSHNAYEDLQRIVSSGLGKNYTITINKAYSKEFANTLIHEVQHAIQDIEGFAEGGNPSTIAEFVRGMEDKAKVWEYSKEVEKVAKDLGITSPYEIERYIISDVLGAKTADEVKQIEKEGWVPDSDGRAKGYNLWARGYDKEGYEKAYNDYYNKMREAGKVGYWDGSPEALYERLAGEVEARNTSRRKGMTADERRNSLAADTEDVAREDQIFLYGNGGSESNDIRYQKAGTYTTKDGVQLSMMSLFESNENLDDNANLNERSSANGDLTELRLRKLEPGETCHVERRYEENKSFSFTGKEKIESMDDVAYIFKQLENAAVENSFIALVKDGKPIIIHTGMGGYASSPVDIRQAVAAYMSINPEQVYFVHNHPSGSLRASREDRLTLNLLREVFGNDVVQDGIIIDTTSGKYGVFGPEIGEGEFGWELGEKNRGEVPMKVYEFSKQVFSKDWKPQTAYTIAGYDGVAEFISSHRLGEHPKMSFIVVNNQNQVVGNLFLPWTALSEIEDVKATSTELSNYINLAGGTKGVIYGNYQYSEKDKRMLQQLAAGMNLLHTPLLDVVHVDVNDELGYHSAHDSGVMKPEAEYVTPAREAGESILDYAKRVADDYSAYESIVKALEVANGGVMEAHDDSVSDIMDDQSMGMQERMTAMATKIAALHADDAAAKNRAYRAIGGNLADLRKAMSLQKEFDRSTVKRVADLARVLLSGGYLDNLSRYEVGRLLSAVKNATGRSDIRPDLKKVMDIMVDNQLKRAEKLFHDLETVKAKKVNAKGVEVIGELDIAGQQIVEAFKKGRKLDKDNIEQKIADAQQRMGSDNKTIADEAANEYTGLQYALEYAQIIKESVDEEHDLLDELEQARLEARNPEGVFADKEAYDQYRASVEEALRQNRVERLQAYLDLAGRLSGNLSQSIANAMEFKEAEKERIADIQHNANSDMEGRPFNEHYTPDWKAKAVNNSFAQFFLQPLATFDQMLRLFGSKSANGEGYLYNRFMRGWVDARQKEISGVRQKYAMLDDKVHQLFGNEAKNTAQLIRRIGSLPKMTVQFWDGGAMKDHTLTQGNLMYMYMVDKMTDGRMKLRSMGVKEEDMVKVTKALDPRLKELADWLQDYFLVETRNEYNETHKRLFGASMAAIENYFPLKILANARADKPEDLDNPKQTEGISTSTGSIIKRRRNALALDILGADAINVVLDHIAQMEHWNAYAEFNRDLNTLRTYKRFRNQVQNMTTVYGSGKELWKKFNDVSQIAAGSYRPPRAILDEAAVNIAKGVTAAKVSFRVFTALKQFLSMPAYLPDARPDLWAKNLTTPWNSWSWAMDNLPIFEERWKSRMAGDPRLLKSELDWKGWRNNIVQMASRIGMAPNAFVDALTVSIGAKTIYETRRARYLKEGYNEEQADQRARQDAEIAYNETQQSSEGAFLSSMQVDRSWLSVMFTVFRNSSMAYQRQLHDALRNLKRDLRKGNREQSIEFMAKQLQRDGLSEDKAQSAAKNRYNRQIGKDLLRVATFGYILQLAWNLGAKLPYLLFGDDDDKKKEMMDDVWAQSMFGWGEGISGGDVFSQGGMMLVQGKGNPEYLMKEMPIASDAKDVLQEIGQGKYGEVVNDMVNLVVQAGIGVNPQSITDAVLAIMDACGDDPALAHEATIAVMRILQVPQSQIKEMYFDELRLSGSEVSNYTPQQLVERYAQYQVKRGRLLAPWTWDDESILDKESKKATKVVKERVGTFGDEFNEALNGYEQTYNEVKERINTAYNEAKQEHDYVKKAQIIDEVRRSDEQAFTTYDDYKRFDKQLDDIVTKYLAAKTPEQASLAKDDIFGFKSRMVDLLGTADEKQRRRLRFQLDEYYRDFKREYEALKTE